VLCLSFPVGACVIVGVDHVKRIALIALWRLTVVVFTVGALLIAYTVLALLNLALFRSVYRLDGVAMALPLAPE